MNGTVNALNTFVNVSKDSIVHTKRVNTEEENVLGENKNELIDINGPPTR